MKQLLLATALVAVPVAAFSTFQVYHASANAGVTAPAGLGDLSPFAAIVADVRARAAQDDLAGARTRIRDFEISWDEAEKSLKPRDGTSWHRIDDATDGALRALRAGTPDPAAISRTPTALQATLQPPATASN